MKRTPFAQQWIDKLKTDPQESFTQFSFIDGYTRDCKACALGKAAQIHPDFTSSYTALPPHNDVPKLLGFDKANDPYNLVFHQIIFTPVTRMNDELSKTGVEIAEFLETVFNE